MIFRVQYLVLRRMWWSVDGGGGQHKAVFAGSSKIDLTSHFRTFESEKWSLFAVLPLQAEGHGCEFALRTLSPRGRPRGREPEFGNREGRP